MIVINGTKKLLTEFYGEPPKETFKSLIVMDGDRPVGVAGLEVNTNKVIAFTDISKELREHKSFKRMIVKVYRRWLEILPNIPVYAQADPKIEGSEKLLEHAGFQHYRGDIWRV